MNSYNNKNHNNNINNNYNKTNSTYLGFDLIVISLVKLSYWVKIYTSLGGGGGWEEKWSKPQPKLNLKLRLSLAKIWPSDGVSEKLLLQRLAPLKSKIPNMSGIPFVFMSWNVTEYIFRRHCPFHIISTFYWSSSQSIFLLLGLFFTLRTRRIGIINKHSPD